MSGDHPRSTFKGYQHVDSERGQCLPVQVDDATEDNAKTIRIPHLRCSQHADQIRVAASVSAQVNETTEDTEAYNPCFTSEGLSACISEQ